MRRPEDCVAGAPSKWGGLGEDNKGGENAGIWGPFLFTSTKSDDIPEWHSAPENPRRWEFRERVRGSASPPRQVPAVSRGILIASNCPGLNYSIRQERP